MTTISNDLTTPPITQDTSPQTLSDKLDSLMGLVKKQNETMATMQTQIQFLVEKQTEDYAVKQKCLKIIQTLCPEAKIENISDGIVLFAGDFKQLLEFSGKVTRNNNLGNMALQEDNYEKAKSHFEIAKMGLEQILPKANSNVPFSPLASFDPILISTYESLMQNLTKCDTKLLLKNKIQAQDAIANIKKLQVFYEEQMISGKIVIDVKKHKALDHTLGLYLFLNKDYTAALTILEDDHKINPDNLYTLYCIGNCQDQLGNTEVAKENYEKLNEKIDAVETYKFFSEYCLEFEFELLIAKPVDSADQNKKAMQDKVNTHLENLNLE